jgi:hypothetical protein
METHLTKEDAPQDAGRKENQTTSHYADLSASAQRARLLDALRIAPITTIEARRNLDILHPAMRVLELRAKGYDIHTIWTHQKTDAGVRHRIARYVLQVEVQNES